MNKVSRINLYLYSGVSMLVGICLMGVSLFLFYFFHSKKICFGGLFVAMTILLSPLVGIFVPEIATAYRKYREKKAKIKADKDVTKLLKQKDKQPTKQKIVQSVIPSSPQKIVSPAQRKPAQSGEQTQPPAQKNGKGNMPELRQGT